METSVQGSIIITHIPADRILIHHHPLGISTWLELTYVGWQSWAMVIVSLTIHIIAVELLKLTLRRLKVTI